MDRVWKNARYWQLRRLIFFFQQRLFSLLSFILLDNLISGHMRSWFLRLNGASIGRHCFVRGSLMIQESFNFSLGDGAFINAGCCLDCSAPITIGPDVQLGYQVTIITGDHEFAHPGRRAGKYNPRPVVIGRGAWIGARSVICPGVTIGEGSVVGAGSIVTADVSSNVLVVGSPARVIRTLSEV